MFCYLVLLTFDRLFFSSWFNHLLHFTFQVVLPNWKTHLSVMLPKKEAKRGTGFSSFFQDLTCGARNKHISEIPLLLAIFSAWKKKDFKIWDPRIMHKRVQSQTLPGLYPTIRLCRKEKFVGYFTSIEEVQFCPLLWIDGTLHLEKVEKIARQ